jgi:hypothetical protein
MLITVAGKITSAETYSVRTAVKPTATAPVQITTGWATYGEGVAAEDYPFTSAEYLVQKLSEPVANELYLVIPKVVTDTDGNGTLVVTSPAADDVRGGSTITLTATPNEGYKIGTVTVTYKDANGNDVTVPVTDNGDGTYTFIMPDTHLVTAYAIFKVPHVHAMSAACEETGSVITFDKELPAAGGTLAAGSYVLTQSMTATGDIVIPAGETVNLCLKGNTMNMGGHTITVHGTLNICDCDRTTAGLITGTAADGVIKVSQGATMNLYGGTFASSTGTAIHNWGTVNTDGLITQDSNGYTSGSTTGITGPKDIIVNEFRAELNVTNASVYTGEHTTLIMNNAGTVTVRATYMETPLAGDLYTCAIYNAPFETGGIRYEKAHYTDTRRRRSLGAVRFRVCRGERVEGRHGGHLRPLYLSRRQRRADRL